MTAPNEVTVLPGEPPQPGCECPWCVIFRTVAEGNWEAGAMRSGPDDKGEVRL